MTPVSTQLKTEYRTLRGGGGRPTLDCTYLRGSHVAQPREQETFGV